MVSTRMPTGEDRGSEAKPHRSLQSSRPHLLEEPHPAGKSVRRWLQPKPPWPQQLPGGYTSILPDLLRATSSYHLDYRDHPKAPNAFASLANTAGPKKQIPILTCLAPGNLPIM